MNSLVSYITLPENGKMASSISPSEVLKISHFYPESHFSVQANFSHSCRFTAYVSALPEIEQHLYSLLIKAGFEEGVGLHSAGLCSELCILSHINYVRARVNQERNQQECLRGCL